MPALGALRPGWSHGSSQETDQPLYQGGEGAGYWSCPGGRWLLPSLRPAPFLAHLPPAFAPWSPVRSLWLCPRLESSVVSAQGLLWSFLSLCTQV